MNRYFTFSYKVRGDEHLNIQDLLPASCNLINGVAVLATSKQVGELKETTQPLCFPQELIKSLLWKEKVTNLFFSYLRTRETEFASKLYFETDILPAITQILSSNIHYTNLNPAQQQKLSNSISNLLALGLPAYLYDEKQLLAIGQSMANTDFMEFILSETLQFLYEHKDEVFTHKVQEYVQPKPYGCGNISLLINGNNFLLRDYTVSANRKVRGMKKEIIPLHEPLQVNSNLHTVFKNNKKNKGNTQITIYIRYEHK